MINTIFNYLNEDAYIRNRMCLVWTFYMNLMAKTLLLLKKIKTHFK